SGVLTHVTSQSDPVVVAVVPRVVFDDRDYEEALAAIELEEARYAHRRAHPAITANVTHAHGHVETVTHDITTHGADSDVMTYVDVFQSWDAGAPSVESAIATERAKGFLYGYNLASDVREAIDDCFKYWASQPGDGAIVTG
ncbi:hypothetical protein UFOVP75_230, partial [uncultured Caudovirales phage]